jgi:hypothetical protein
VLSGWYGFMSIFNDLVAAGVLGFVQSGVGAGGQLVRGLGTIPKGQTGGESLSQRRRQPHPINDLAGLCSRRAGEQYDEFLAAVAGQMVDGA